MTDRLKNMFKRRITDIQKNSTISDQTTSPLLPGENSKTDQMELRESVEFSGHLDFFDEDESTRWDEPERSLGKISMNHENIRAAKKFEVNGYEIYFPFEAYEIQKAFIASLIKSLDTRGNGLLQSPTGTGKTLSLLTGALAFLHSKRESGEFTKTSIIYCSRTHSQVKQLVRELKKTCYHPKVCVLGSRDQLCVNDQLGGLSGSEKNLECRKLCHGGNCVYNENFREKKKHIMSANENEILDIEEIAAIGKKKEFCSYYFSRTMAHRADIIFAPYNYITNTQFRSILADEIKDSIMIFDEAHNLDHFAEEGSSFTLSTDNLEQMEKEFKALEKGLTQHKIK